MRRLSEWPATDDPETVEWRAWFCRETFVVIDGDGVDDDGQMMLPLLSLIEGEAS